MSHSRCATDRLLSVALTLAVCLMLPGPALSDDATKPVEELVELDEVRVRGKLVANAVIAAENRVFALYNKLNKDNRYDVHCRDVRARQSLALLRICLPEFVSSYSPPALYPVSVASLQHTYLPHSSCLSSVVYLNGSMDSMRPCGYDYNYTYTSRTPNYWGTGRLPPAQAQSIVAPPARVAEFKQNMTRVMNSDPELHELAEELAGMYREVKRIQDRYAALQEERRAAQKARWLAARQSGRKLGSSHPRAP